MKNFTEIIIRTQPFSSELLSGVVQLFTTLMGIEEGENELVCYFSEFSDEDFEYLKKLLLNLQNEALIERFNVYNKIIEQKNWNEEWEKTIQPIKVSDKIVIKPSFRDYNPTGDDIVITIDPKMSFGTGYHQSTRIMIRLIERNIEPNMKVLDIGTGTGILAIVSAKLGARKIICCDNDEFVQENVRENFDKNNVGDKCSFIVGTIENIQNNDFDLILANIQKNVLLEIALDIRNKIKKNGLVILSGLLVEDELSIIEKYSGLGFHLFDKEIENEWIGLAFRFSN